MSKKSVSQKEYQKVEEEASAAREILEEDRFGFLRDYLTNSKTSIETAILNNTIREVQEIVPITDKLTRIFKQPKQVQVDELSGKYKFITQLLADLEYFAQRKKDLDTEITEKRVTLE